MPREFLIGPILFTLIGSCAGICWGMVFHDRAGRVDIVDGGFALLVGSMLGLLIGVFVYLVCRRSPGLLPPFAFLGVTLLLTAIATVIGWIVGNAMIPREAKSGLKYGSLIGVSMGIIFGTMQFLSERRLQRQDFGPIRFLP